MRGHRWQGKSSRLWQGLGWFLALLCWIFWWMGDSRLVRGIDSQAQPLPFTQDWSATTLISANDDWSGVLGIEGYLGQNLTTATGADPQTLLTTSTLANDLDVIANQSNPNTLSSGGVAEFDGISNPSIALQGSATADAPYLLLHLDTTGRTKIQVSYNLRDLDGSADNAIQPVALQYRLGSTGSFLNLPDGFVADATTGPSEATLVTPVRVLLPSEAENRPLVQLRILTANAVGNDEWVGVDDLLVTSEGDQPALSLADVSSPEGDAGTREFLFTVRLTSPAGPSGVSFQISTVDGTATVADQDYLAKTLPAQSIPPGGTSYQFGVTVVGDAKVEPDETFQVRVSQVTGAQVTRGEAVGILLNDDLSFVPIRAIQGSSARSPIERATVRTRGVVTARKSNGFFLQEPDASVDADPATSEGLFVFTSSTPPTPAAVGNLVEVEGTVTEFVPSSDPLQPPMTQLTNLTLTTVLSTAQSLPVAIPLTTTFPDPAGPHDQLERLEGMRVRVASLTVVSPTQGFIQETAATASSNGVFYGVVTGVPRPFREPGIQAPDPPPSGTIPPIPRFDANPERLRVNTLGLMGQAALNVATGALVTGLIGPLEYSTRCYTVLPDPGTTLTATGGLAPRAVSRPQADEWTVATFNLQRFYDSENDPAISEPVLTTEAYRQRLGKASLAIRQYLQTPDILGVVEVENQATLQSLAARIGEDALQAGDPDPQYQAWLVEGQDVGGIDVGFLVRTSAVGGAGTPPRVEVQSVVQELQGSRFLNPNGTGEALHDRPPLRLSATLHFANGRRYPVTVINNHLRSLNGVASLATGSDGWATVGDRVRAKRQRQAEDLARLVQARQVASPDEALVLVGDFNAFEFNDGLTASLATIAGLPFPDAETVVPGDGLDLVNPDLLNLLGAVSTERYSYLFDGSAQSLDHILVNRALLTSTRGQRLEAARFNADFPEVARNQATTPTRLSDHDPLVAFIQLAAACPSPPPLLPLPSYAGPQTVVEGASLRIAPSSVATESSGVSYQIAGQGLFTGDVTIDPQGAISIEGAAPVGTHRLTIRVEDLCGQTGEVQLSLIVLATTEVPGPGTPLPIFSPIGAQRSGSLLVFNLYTSSSLRRGIDSRISLTNSHPTRFVSLRLFLIDGATGLSTALQTALTANQTTNFLASDLDPDVTGYLLVVATDAEGRPVSFNHLIGHAFVRTESGHLAGLAAMAVPALLPEANLTAVVSQGVATLSFDGKSYGSLPRTLAISSLGSPEEGNQSLLVLNRLGGDLTRPLAALGQVGGWLYDNVETPWRFSFPHSTCQFLQLLGGNGVPRLSPPYDRILGRGRSGWMRLFLEEPGGALTGALLQRNPLPAGMTQGRNLHHLTTTPEAQLRLPLL